MRSRQFGRLLRHCWSVRRVRCDCRCLSRAVACNVRRTKWFEPEGPAVRSRCLRGMVSAIVACGLGLVVMGVSAPEAGAASVCVGQPATKIVKWYIARVPYRNVPLRCGTATYGYNHVVARWISDPPYDYNISSTVAHPQWTTGAGSSVTFEAYASRCPGGIFRVVVEYSNYADGNPKGFITAYNVSAAAASKGSRVLSAASC
jgi:hypothetical protein